MKRLNDILSNITTIAVAHDANPVIHHIGYDSRAMKPGSMFFALRGLTHDGHSYIGQAVANGAIAVVCETLPDTTEKHVTYITVKNSRLSIAQAAANYYDHPSTRIKLIGVTGTNGKTTIATLLHQLFTGMGYKAGLISTIRYITGTDTFDASHTTPDAIRINALLHEMAAEGCTYCFMEVSSHAIKQHRIEGLVFTGGIFTNLTHDHLDYHTSFDDYRDTKKQFFDQLPEHAWALINGEDRNASYIAQNSEAKIFTYAVKGMADYSCTIIDDTMEGLNLRIDGKELWSILSGLFNAKNLLAVYGAARLEGFTADEILPLLSIIGGAEGRFQKIRNDKGVTAIVDYAHSPDALENILKAVTGSRGDAKQVITVVGAGGNRDPYKRPKMASVAVFYSNQVILTSDNPRNEDAEKIIDDMERKLDPVEKRKVIRIANRKEAIKTACRMAHQGDIILVAGKGHEKYQEIGGVKHPFDDVEIVKEFLINND